MMFPLRLHCLLLACAVFLLGCGGGPAADVLRSTLQSRLDREFKDGLFTIQRFRRMGSHWGRNPKTGQQSVLVYYDAELSFRRPYSVADWNTLGIEALGRVLGTGPKGIDGIESEGNQKGQRLAIHGTLPFVRFKGKWILDSADAVVASKAGAESRALQSQYGEIKTMLGEYEAASQKAIRARSEEQLAILHSFLRQARNRAFKRIQGQKRDELVIVTGHATGTYYPLGTALAMALNKAGLAARSQQSEGSTENCKLVAHGYADLAICQNDVLFEALAGTGPFAGQALKDIAALCAWYPEPVQIVVRSDDPIRRVDELRGKTLAVGQYASGSFVNALQILEGAGLAGKEGGCKLLRIHPAAALAQLLEGKVAAVFLTEGAPATHVNELTRLGKLRLLDMDAELIDRLVKKHPFFSPMTLPARTYLGQSQDLRTVAVTSLLVASTKLPRETVERIMTIHYERLPLLAKAHPKGSAIARKTARLGLSIPLHPGAEAFFRSSTSKR